MNHSKGKKGDRIDFDQKLFFEWIKDDKEAFVLRWYFEFDGCLRDFLQKKTAERAKEPRRRNVTVFAFFSSIAFSWSQYWSKIVFRGNNGTRISWMELPLVRSRFESSSETIQGFCLEINKHFEGKQTRRCSRLNSTKKREEFANFSCNFLSNFF